MLDARSPLGDNPHFEAEGISLWEDKGFELILYSGTERALARELAVEATFGTAAAHYTRLFFRVGQEQVWGLGSKPETRVLHETPLTSSRCRIALEGMRARSLLAAVAPVDFSAAVFKPGHYVMTGIHHTPVLIHCTGENGFHIYAMRSFALSVWEWLVDASAGL